MISFSLAAALNVLWSVLGTEAASTVRLLLSERSFRQEVTQKITERTEIGPAAAAQIVAVHEGLGSLADGSLAEALSAGSDTGELPALTQTEAERLADTVVECFIEAAARRSEPLLGLVENRLRLVDETTITTLNVGLDLHEKVDALGEMLEGIRPLLASLTPPDLISFKATEPADGRASIISVTELLRPEASIFAFSGRDEELSELEAWSLSEPTIDVRALTGPAGYGKTRLAYELSARLATRGWKTVAASPFATPNETARRLSVEDGHLLVVLDYAENLVEQSVAALHGARQRKSTHSTRLLLLSRSCRSIGGLPTWLDAIRQRTDFYLPGLQEDPSSLRPFLESAEDRMKFFERACRSIGQAMEGHSERAPLPQWDFSTKSFDAPIWILAGALLWTDESISVEGDYEARPTPPALRRYLLDKEARHWRRSAPAQLGQPSSDGVRHRMVAIGTLAGAERRTDAISLLSLRDTHVSDPVVACDYLARLYEGPGYVNPIPLDMVADDLIEQTIELEPDLVSKLLDVVTPTQLNNLMHALSRTSIETVLLASSRVTDHQIQEQGPALLDASLHLRSSFLELHRRCLETQLREAPVGHEDLIAAQLGTVYRALGRTGESIELLAPVLERWQPGETVDTTTIELFGAADALVEYGMSLGQAGRYQESLHVLQHATGLQKAVCELASTPTFALSSNFVTALIGLSNAYRHLGRIDESKRASTEAVETARRLDDLPAFELAELLVTHAVILGSDSDGYEEALVEAKDILETLPQSAGKRRLTARADFGLSTSLGVGPALAIELWERSMSALLAEQVERPLDAAEASVLFQSADLLRSTGQVTDVEEIYQKLNAVEVIDDPSLEELVRGVLLRFQVALGLVTVDDAASIVRSARQAVLDGVPMASTRLMFGLEALVSAASNGSEHATVASASQQLARLLLRENKPREAAKSLQHLCDAATEGDDRSLMGAAMALAREIGAAADPVESVGLLLVDVVLQSEDSALVEHGRQVLRTLGPNDGEHPTELSLAIKVAECHLDGLAGEIDCDRLALALAEAAVAADGASSPSWIVHERLRLLVDYQTAQIQQRRVIPTQDEMVELLSDATSTLLQIKDLPQRLFRTAIRILGLYRIAIERGAEYSDETEVLRERLISAMDAHTGVVR